MAHVQKRPNCGLAWMRGDMVGVGMDISGVGMDICGVGMDEG